MEYLLSYRMEVSIALLLMVISLNFLSTFKEVKVKKFKRLFFTLSTLLLLIQFGLNQFFESLELQKEKTKRINVLEISLYLESPIAISPKDLMTYESVFLFTESGLTKAYKSKSCIGFMKDFKSKREYQCKFKASGFKSINVDQFLNNLRDIRISIQNPESIDFMIREVEIKLNNSRKLVLNDEVQNFIKGKRLNNFLFEGRSLGEVFTLKKLD